MFFAALAALVLAVHLAIILFNLFGLIAIPLGVWRGWRFVRILWWRALHLAILGVVALQAVLDRVCFLTLWQSDLLARAGEPSSAEPLIERWIEHLIFWPLPTRFFLLLYVAVCAYTLALWRLVPPDRRRSRSPA
jgi:hypothetical protein